MYQAIKSKIKKGVTFLTTLAVLANPLYADDATVRARAGHNSSGLETEITGNFSKNLSYMSRNTITTDYENNVNTFFFADISYNIGKGISAVSETQAAPGMGIVQRAGLSLFKSKGGASAYILSTAKVGKDIDCEVLGILSYVKLFPNNMYIAAASEDFVNFGKEGLNFITSNNRVGIGKNSYMGGLSANMTFDNELNPTFDFGIFLSRTFGK